MTIIRTEFGDVQGSVERGLNHFQGVPFAAPPFGALRFRAPTHPAAWDGVRDATMVGPAAPQPRMDDPFGDLFIPALTGEDCLTLDIWTPDPGASSLPVMVHTHGGGYLTGAGSLPGYSGRAFARDGIVHVGINYRLGIDGFLHLPDAPDNRGLRDQVFALEWVQRNIHAFGGDPGRVTIYGQSGGGVSVMALLGLPAARGLFRGAIPMSGCSVASVDADEALVYTRQVARGLRRAPTAQSLSAVPLDRTVQQAKSSGMRYILGMLRGDPRALLITPYRLVHGTDFFPETALDNARTVRGIPLLTGTSRNESVEFIAGLGSSPGLPQLVRRGLRRALRLDNQLVRAYREGPRRLTDAPMLLEAAWTDWGFRIPTVRLLESWQGPRWAYEFQWESPKLPHGMGASHGLEHAFVRDDLDHFLAAGGQVRLGDHPPQELATAMHDAWVRFATTGEPGWAPYELGDRTTMVFDSKSSTQSDPPRQERIAWAGRR